MSRFQGDASKKRDALGRLRDRVFSGAMVRQICDRAYGDRISHEAWRNWRKWARVSKDRRVYTFDEFCFLYGVATIRSKSENRYRQLWREEVLDIANNVETQKLLADFIHWFDAGLVVGKDAPTALAARGVRVSVKTLYRNVPGFSVSKIYNIEDLKFWSIG